MTEYEKFHGMLPKQCLYGQKFGNSQAEDAMTFKKDYNIPLGFGVIGLEADSEESALEMLIYKLWEEESYEQVFNILDTFVIWSDKPNNNNLFVL